MLVQAEYFQKILRITREELISEYPEYKAVMERHESEIIEYSNEYAEKMDAVLEKDYDGYMQTLTRIICKRPYKKNSKHAKSVLRYMTLYMGDKKDKKAFITYLSDCYLDDIHNKLFTDLDNEYRMKLEGACEIWKRLDEVEDAKNGK